MMFHMAVDKRVSKNPVQHGVTWQVQDSVGHLVDPLWSARRGEHGEANVLENVDVDVRHREHCSADEHAEQSAERRVEPGDVDQQPVLRVQTQRYHQNGPNDVSQRVSFELT